MLTRRTYVMTWMTTERQAFYKARALRECCLAATLHNQVAHFPRAPSFVVGTRIHAHRECQTPVFRGWAWMRDYEIPWYATFRVTRQRRRLWRSGSGWRNRITGKLGSGCGLIMRGRSIGVVTLELAVKGEADSQSIRTLDSPKD